MPTSRSHRRGRLQPTVTTRLAINELRSARARRERYVGEWLPEPIITDGADDPARHAETADSLSLAQRRASSKKSSRPGFSQPPSKATSPAWRRCSLLM